MQTNVYRPFIQLLSIMIIGIGMTSIISCKKDSPITKPADFDLLYGQFKAQYGKSYDSLQYYYNIVSKKEEVTNNPYYTFLASVLHCSILGVVSEYSAITDRIKPAIDIAKNELKSDSLISISLNILGNSYKNQSDYESAMKYFLQSDSLGGASKHMSRQQIIDTKINIAKCYFVKQEAQKAKKIIEEIELTGDKELINPTGMHLLANYYGQAGQIDSALSIDNKYINLLTELKSYTYLSPFLNNKANCYIALSQPDSAIFYINKSIKIDYANNDIKNVGANHLLYAEAYQLKKDYNKSKYHINQARQIYRKLNIKQNEYSCFYLMLNEAKAAKDFQSAFAYIDSMQRIKGEMNGIAINTRIEAINIQNQTSLKTTQLARQKEKLANYQIIMGLLALVLTLGVSLFLHLLKKSKNNTLLLLQQQMQKASLSIIEAEQKERVRIATELHDSLGQKLTVLKMHAHSRDKDSFDLIPILDETINEVRNISHNLMPEILSLGLTTAIRDLASYGSSTKMKFSLEINPVFDSLSFSDEVKITVYRCTQEILNNAIKHSKATQISIVMDYKDNSHILIIEDNGIGFDLDKPNSGHGLFNIKTRMQVIKGEVTISSSYKGSKFTLKF